MARVLASPSPAWLRRPSLVAPGPEGCSDAIQGEEDNAHPWIWSGSNSRTRSTRPGSRRLVLGNLRCSHFSTHSHTCTNLIAVRGGVRLLSRGDAKPWGGSNPRSFAEKLENNGLLSCF